MNGLSDSAKVFDILQKIRWVDNGCLLILTDLERAVIVFHILYHLVKV